MNVSLVRIGSLTVLALMLGVAVSSAAEWGDLKGRFVYDGEPPQPKPIMVTKDVEHFGNLNLVDESLVVGPDGGVANVIVYVRTPRVEVHPDYEASAGDEVVLDNHGGRFEPRIVPIRLSQTLLVKNSDPCPHNSNIQPLGDVGVNPLLPAAGTIEHKFNRAQNIPVPVSCNVHPWMNGYVLPRDNPYAVVSDKDGTFVIEKLPAGTELEFQFWQEKAGYLQEVTVDDQPAKWERGRMTMTLAPGENDLGTIKLAPKVFEK